MLNKVVNRQKLRRVKTCYRVKQSWWYSLSIPKFYMCVFENMVWNGRTSQEGMTITLYWKNTYTGRCIVQASRDICHFEISNNLYQIYACFPHWRDSYNHDGVIKWKHFPRYWPSTGHRWIPLTKASDAELWGFLRSAPEQTVGETIERRWLETLIMTSLWWLLLAF